MGDFWYVVQMFLTENETQTSTKYWVSYQDPDVKWSLTTLLNWDNYPTAFKDFQAPSELW